MTKDEKKILSEIVELDGACLDSSRCKNCPFKRKCLPEFITSKRGRPSKPKRLAMALDALANLELFDEVTVWRPNER